MSTISSLLKQGHIAVVTGASSGIGRAACLEFATRGMKVWMIDNDKEELDGAKEFIQTTSKNNSVEARHVDVSDAGAMDQLAKEVFEKDAKCHILMNNAGITGNGKSAITSDIQKFHETMNVNTYGPINGCLAFVPSMIQSKQEGIIINTGSKQGITMPPGNIAYNMSKGALKVYTEGLEHELMKLRQEENGKLRCALLVPGWVNTSIFLKKVRADCVAEKGSFDLAKDYTAFSEANPAKDAWMPKQVVDFMISELDDTSKFYVICPDNDVDRQTDNLRMTWTMQDITKDRPPLSRWHPDYKDQFTEYLEENKK